MKKKQDKPKILVIGGKKKNITQDLLDRVDVVQVENAGRNKKDPKIPTNKCPDAIAIVELRQWITRQAHDRAKEIAQARRIPLLFAETGNYILNELIEKKVIPKDPPNNGKKKTKTVQRKKELDTTPEGLWNIYGQSLTNSVRDLVKPGEKILKSELLDIMEDEVGPREHLEIILPELNSQGILLNVSGDIWKRPGEEYEYDEEEEEELEEIVPKMVKSDALAGLPAGPYKSKGAIIREMMKYKEFLKSDGNPITEGQGYLIIKSAEKKGIVLRRDGMFFIKVRSDLKLTSLEEPVKLVTSYELKRARRKEDEEPVVERKKETKEDEKTSVEAKEVKPVAAPDPPKGDRVVATGRAKSARAQVLDLLGEIPLPFFGDAIERLRMMLPDRVWDQAARRSISRRLMNRGHENKTVDESVFTDEEWFSLSMETLQEMPLKAIIPELLDDHIIRCQSCVQKGKTGPESLFIFTMNDYEYHKQRFTEVRLPRDCQVCRKERKGVRY